MTNLENLRHAHSKFVYSIEGLVVGEVLVGTLCYTEEHNITPKSDVDSMVVVEREKLGAVLDSPLLRGTLSPELAEEALRLGLSEYIVLKTKIDGLQLSADIIPSDFFDFMCNMDLTKQTKTFASHKFGNEPQQNSYPTVEFNGRTRRIDKNNLPYKEGFVVELPLFFIFDNETARNYSYGMPTVKLLTSRVSLDNGLVQQNVDHLFMNVLRRLRGEYPDKTEKELAEYFFNILVKRQKFSEDYRNKLELRVLEGLRCLRI